MRRLSEFVLFCVFCASIVLGVLSLLVIVSQRWEIDRLKHKLQVMEALK